MAEALIAQEVGVHYGSKVGLEGVSLELPAAQCTALIGPSGCGKSTLLRCFNRMNERIPGAQVSGTVLLGTKNIYEDLDPIEVRRRVGMVFQRPNPFPQSIYDNVAAGPKRAGLKRGSELDHIVETCLREVNLWDEVSNKLKAPALALSGGQQQRLCIARALAVEPDALLLDEPTSALDPISTGAIEELMRELSQEHTLVLVTHTMQQARRVAHQTAFFYMGHLIEAGPTTQIFEAPQTAQLQQYLSGIFS